MFNNVLVGVDEAQGGRDAIALAEGLRAPRGDLTLAHVCVEPFLGSRAWSDPEAAPRRETARELLEHAVAEAGVTAHIRWHGASSVGRGLHELAEAIEADLLVVGSSRHGLHGRVRITDDTRAALNGAPCAIAVAPGGYSAEPHSLMREIGVGYDGSPAGEQALALARTLADEMQAKLSAFQAVAIPNYLFHGRSAVAGNLIKDAVDEAREQIGAHEGVEAHAAYGDPAEELTLYSASLDLLVLGSRNYGPLGRLVHGRTTQHLARTARCPLLVVTRTPLKTSAPSGSADRRESRSPSRV
jgi:nucleotide-binding universal stress UspA family protein